MKNPLVLLRHLFIMLNRPIYRQISNLSTIGLSMPINTLLPHRFQFSMLRRLTWINTVVLLRHLLIKLNRPIYRQISILSKTGLSRSIITLLPHRFYFQCNIGYHDKALVLLGHLLFWRKWPIYRQISILRMTGLSRPIHPLLPHRFQFSM